MNIAIFAGGVGTRLWPLSRKHAPKQMLHIVGDKTMIQLVYDRFIVDSSPDAMYLATSASYVDDIRNQVPQIPSHHILPEPEMRDVGPAVAVISAILAQSDPDKPTLYVYGADHIYKDEAKHRRLVQAANAYLSRQPDRIVLFGEKPRFASQNLGWISYGEAVGEAQDVPIYAFNGFRYKPEKDVAETYFQDAHHAWNLGDFASTPRFVMEQFERYEPEIHAYAVEIAAAFGTDSFDETLKRLYPKMKKIHMDNAVMERLSPEHAVVVHDQTGWADIGAWEALKEALEESPDANVTRGPVITRDSKDNLMYNYENGKLVVGIDLEGCVIVNTPDVLLITHKTSIGKVKEVVKSLEDTEYADRT